MRLQKTDYKDVKDDYYNHVNVNNTLHHQNINMIPTQPSASFLQNRILNMLINSNEEVYIELNYNKSIPCRILQYDEYTILIEGRRKEHYLVYKNSISYISLLKNKTNDK